MNQKDFRLRLKELRLKRGLTQSQLANIIGITRQAYVNYETGRRIPPAETITKLSQELGVDFMEILYNHSTITNAKIEGLLNQNTKNDFFVLLELYSKLNPLAQKRILNLMTIMSRGGDV